MSDATRAALHGQASLSARIQGMDVTNPYPSTDAADTSSFTLSRQRENIAGVEVETFGLISFFGLVDWT